MSLGCWNKKHIQVLYRGVDITDKMGLCICEECTNTLRGSVDALLDTKELPVTALNSQSKLCSMCEIWARTKFDFCPSCGRALC